MNRCGRASQWIEEAAAASIVSQIATIGVGFAPHQPEKQRERRRRSARSANRTTACRPPCAFSQRKQHVRQPFPREPGLARLSKRRRCRAPEPGDWPESIRPCGCASPVSQSPSSVFTPFMRPNRNAIGMRNAKSVNDGSNFSTNWEPCAFSCHFFRPSSVFATGCMASISAHPIVERAKIHIIDAQCDPRAFRIGAKCESPSPGNGCTSARNHDSPAILFRP